MPRLVIVEPAYASTVGHHGEVNRPLLAALGAAGWAGELWSDLALEGEPARLAAVSRWRPGWATACCLSSCWAWRGS